MIGRNSQLLRCLLLGAAQLLLLSLTNAIISGSFNGFVFTAPDQPDSNRMKKDRAQQWCQNNSSTLMEIYSSSLQRYIASFVNDNSGQGLGRINMFTNGMRNTSSPSWQWVNGKDFTSGLGVSNQQSSDYAFRCLQQNQAGVSFLAELPAVQRNYICEGTSFCDKGIIRDGRCYEASGGTLSWYDARNRCRDGGGDLASFDFVTDQQSLNSLNGTWLTANTLYWIGLRRQWWTWPQSNSEIKYTAFQEGHPNPVFDCLCVLSKEYSYVWSDCDCNQEYQFICMRREYPETSPTSAATTQSLWTPQSPLSPASPASPVSSSAEAKDKSTSDMRLGVGIGVGVGGLLIIIVVVVVVVLLIRKRRHKGLGNSRSQRRLQIPDIIGQQQDSSAYAEIQRTSNDDTETNKANDKTNIVYSDLQIRDAV